MMAQNGQILVKQVQRLRAADSGALNWVEFKLMIQVLERKNKGVFKPRLRRKIFLPKIKVLTDTVLSKYHPTQSEHF